MITNILISSSEHILFLLKALSMTVWQSESFMENNTNSNTISVVLCENTADGSVCFTLVFTPFIILFTLIFLSLISNLIAIYRTTPLSKLI